MKNENLNPLSSIDAELADRLENDEAFRNRFIRFWAQNEVAAELRTLRKERKMRQAEVAKLARTGQSAISRIEKADYDAWGFKTLVRVAEILRARLRIKLEKIEDVVGSYRAGSNVAALADVDIVSGVGTATADHESIEQTSTGDDADFFADNQNEQSRYLQM